MPDPLEPSRVAPVSEEQPSTANNPDVTEASSPTDDGVPEPRPKADPHIASDGKSVFGPYRILAELGRGGMGVVYLAEELELKRRVALKVMLPSVASDPKAVVRFRREAEAQAKVEHDHVTAIYRVGVVDGIPYLAMPLLRGQTLSAALRLNPRPPLAEVVRIAREMAEGLAAAHAVGLIHRDIKPGNVWLEGTRRRVKILDFGLARSTTPSAGDPATVTGTILGTPSYMAPEQARSQPIERRTDLWSLGVILYQMTTGRMPFEGESVFDLLTAVVAHQPRLVSELAPETPPALSGLIHRLMAKNSADRPINAGLVADELAAIERGLVVPPVQVIPLSGAPSESDPWSDLSSAVTHPGALVTEAAEPGSRTVRSKPRNPRWPLLLVAVALVAAGALVVAAVRKTAPQPKADTAEQPPPPPPVVKPFVKAPDKAPTNDQHEAALWVLKQKGGRNTTAVHIKRTGSPKSEVVRDPAALPTVPFSVVGATLDAILPEYAADVTKVFASLGNLEVLQFNGVTWTDALLATAITALKGKTIDKLEVGDVTEPLPKTVAALQQPAAVTWLQLITAAPDGIPVVSVGTVRGAKALRLGTGLTDKSLVTFPEWAAWPDVLNLQGNPNLGDSGVAHIRSRTGARAGIKLVIDLTGTAVTADGAAALAARLPESTVVWSGGTIGPLAVAARTAAAKAILDRGGQITLAGDVPVTQPDALGAQSIGYLQLRAGTFRNPGPANAGSPSWDSISEGPMKEPFGDADLGTLRNLNRATARLYLVGQKFTARGYAELLAMPQFTGVASLWITNCDLGDDAVPAIVACAGLQNLYLSDTKITEAGLKLLRPSCAALTSLRLAGTGLTDTAVPALATFPLLTALDLKDTKLTADGTKQLAARLPYTLIRGPDGRVIEPTRTRPVRDDALAALLKRGARFWIGSAAPIDAPAKLLPTTAQVSLRLATGPYEVPVPPAGGWTKAETGTVADPFDDAELFALVNALKLKDLQSAHLNGQKLTDEGASAFLMLPPVQFVKELDLSNSAVGDETATVAAGLPELQRLQLSDTKVTDAGVKAIAEGRPGLLRLRLANTAVTDEVIPHLEKLFALTDIDLKGTKVSKEGANRLSAALPHTEVRYGDGKVLREAEKGITRESAAARLFERGTEVAAGTAAITTAVDLLAKSATSVSIRLASGPHPAVATPALKWDVAATNKTTEPFGDAELCQVIGALRPNEFGRVSLVGQNVTDAGIATLAATLASQKITHLEVSYCGAGDASVRHLAGFPLLKTLYMNGTNVTDAGVKHLVARADTLDALRMADTKVSDAAIPDLKKLTLLTVLDLKGTEVSDAGAKELAAALPKCHIRYGTGTELGPRK